MMAAISANAVRLVTFSAAVVLSSKLSDRVAKNSRLERTTFPSRYRSWRGRSVGQLNDMVQPRR
jgi:hypothetical protein